MKVQPAEVNASEVEEADLEMSIPHGQYEILKKLRTPDVFYFPFDKPGLEKPWLESGEKNDEYFNYGM